MGVDMSKLEKCTDAFVEGASHLANNGVELDVIVNALISAVITVCYSSRQPPAQLKSALMNAALQVPAMYERQDQILRSKAN